VKVPEMKPAPRLWEQVDRRIPYGGCFSTATHRLRVPGWLDLPLTLDDGTHSCSGTASRPGPRSSRSRLCSQRDGRIRRPRLTTRVLPIRHLEQRPAPKVLHQAVAVPGYVRRTPLFSGKDPREATAPDAYEVAGDER